MTRRPVRAAAGLLSLLVPLAAALALWWPLVDNYFYNDDFVHLFDVVTLGLPRLLTQIWGGHLYVVRNAVFAGMYAVFGPEPRPWFYSVLLTHLLNVLLLHRLVLRLTGDRLLACLGATLWGTAPVLEGALGWYAVYGQVLLTAIVLGVVSSLAVAATSGRPTSLRRGLAWAGLLAAGATCFGIGLGIIAAFPLVAWLALPPDAPRGRAAGILIVTAAAVFVVYAVLWVRSPDLEPRGRELLSPGAVLESLPAVLALGASLLGFSASTLVLGPLGLDAGFPDAATIGTASLVAAVVLLGWLAADSAGRRRLLWLGTLMMAACAAIAAGRATIIVSWQVPIARSAAWSRYHYLLLALLTALLCTALSALRARGRIPGAIVAATAVVCVVGRLALLVALPHAIDHHDADRAETGTVLQAIRQAVAAAPPGTTVTIPNRPFVSAGLPRSFPGWAGVFVIHFPANSVDGRAVRFTPRAGGEALAQQRGGRIAALFQAP